MALQIASSTSSGSGVRFNLGTTDDMFVLAGIAVGSTDGIAIQGTGNSHQADIYGTVIALSTAIQLGDSSSLDYDNRAIIHAGALVYSANYVGVWAQGYASYVINEGTITGQYGVAVGGIAGGTTTTVQNSGSILGGASGFGIIRFTGATEKMVITNTGLIEGQYAFYSNAIVAVDEITNTGTMRGNIYLDSGDDLYDGRNGRLTGTVVGGFGDDRLYGGVDNDTFYGNDGADTLKGNNGNDTLDGGADADRMEGGAGNDKFFVDNVGDVVVELSGKGTDTVESTITWTLGANVENLILAGATAINGTGNSLANSMTGNSAANTLKALEGNDKLTGDDGADKLTGGTGADQFIYKALTDSDVASSGRDTIYDFSHAQGDKINLSAIDAQASTGGNQAFTFIGKSTFSGDEGQLRYKFSGSNTIVEGDVDGNGSADFAILLAGKLTLVKGDFVL
ncbi:calcium-binding protein [Ciceribacter sp. L1K22]|uniref:calcium-binding protein n=1 Tax=Ciceribacter sp. L1K22 TaxID=2820275 RepID=UPI001ABED74A|nr:calcium-binding protein [Ciceribacter sp. L1K22]MBO3759443.1 hypothetical protein [Ciceribacter sp. L1K22]